MIGGMTDEKRLVVAALWAKAKELPAGMSADEVMKAMLEVANDLPFSKEDIILGSAAFIGELISKLPPDQRADATAEALDGIRAAFNRRPTKH